jgi:hypothetical protein
MADTLRDMLIRLHSMGYKLGQLDGHDRPDAAALDLIARIEQFVDDVETVVRQSCKSPALSSPDTRVGTPDPNSEDRIKG